MLAFTLVFYFIIVFPELFIGINNCSKWTHERDKSSFSSLHEEDKAIMLNYLSVRPVFDWDKRNVLKSLCYVLKHPWFPPFSFNFPFPFLFHSLPFLFFYPFVLDELTSSASPPFLPSQVQSDLQKTDYRLHEVKSVLSTFTVEREQTIQASFNYNISPEGEKRVRQHLV